MHLDVHASTAATIVGRAVLRGVERRSLQCSLHAETHAPPVSNKHHLDALRTNTGKVGLEHGTAVCGGAGHT